jgi:hypothetical protein
VHVAPYEARLECCIRVNTSRLRSPDREYFQSTLALSRAESLRYIESDSGFGQMFIDRSYAQRGTSSAFVAGLGASEVVFVGQ